MSLKTAFLSKTTIRTWRNSKTILKNFSFLLEIFWPTIDLPKTAASQLFWWYRFQNSTTIKDNDLKSYMVIVLGKWEDPMQVFFDPTPIGSFKKSFDMSEDFSNTRCVSYGQPWQPWFSSMMRLMREPFWPHKIHCQTFTSELIRVFVVLHIGKTSKTLRHWSWVSVAVPKRHRPP